jgi:general secretion pathway protein D
VAIYAGFACPRTTTRILLEILVKQYNELQGVNEQVVNLHSTWFKNRCLQAVVLSVLFLLSAMFIADVSAAQSGEQNNSQLIRVRIFTLRYISADQAKEYLTSAQIAETIVAIPNTTAISVAGKPEELVYATVVLKLVDSNETFDVKMLDVEQGKSMPLSAEIDKKLGSGYSVGSLLDGPASGASIKTIAALHKDKLLIISPAGQTAKITETVLNSLISPKPVPKAVASANDVNVNDVNAVKSAVEPNAVAESNLPAIGSKVEISVNGKTQTEEDKLLAEFMSELTDASKAEPNTVHLTPQQQAAEIAKRKLEPKPAEQTVIAESAAVVKPAEKTQEPAAVEQTQVKDENVLLTAKIDDANKSAEANQPKTIIEVKQAAIPVIDIPNGDEELTLNLPEKLEIVSLIDLVGKYLNLNYLYDEAKIQGAVTIKVQGKLKVRQLYDILESVLKFRGFAMSRKGNLVTIVPVAEALDQDPTFSGDIKPGDVIVTKIFKLKYINTMAAKQLLVGMKLGNDLTITPIAETGSLVITEYAVRMQRIEDLLSIVDVPGPPKEFKLRVLKYTLAESLVPKIQALAEQLGTVNVTVGTTSAQSMSPMSRARAIRTPVPLPPAPQPGQAQDTTANKTGVFIDFDKRTNRVLMIGLAAELVAVNQIIDSLDVPQQDLRSIREYEIQYIDIESVVTALKDFGIIDPSTNISSGGNSFTSSSRMRQMQQQQQQQPGMINPTMQGNSGAESLSSIDQPQVVVLESTNSLLVNATPEQQLQIARIISYMDREPVQSAIPYHIYRLENQEPEALAEVLNNFIEKTVKDKEGKIQSTTKFQEDIVVVPDKNTFSLIVYASKKKQEWIGALITQLDTRRPQVLIDVSLVEITRDDIFNYDLNIVANAKGLVTDNVGVATKALNAAVGGNREAGFVGSTGTINGFYSADKIQALLTMVNTKSYGRILARPKVLVNDNEKGTISTEDTRYITNISTTALSGSTAGAGAVQSSVAFNPYAAKIQLNITPQISEGNLLRLEIKMERNDFVGDGAIITLADGTKTQSPPNEKKSSVDTIVTVPDGSTIILGGLTKLNQNKAGNKVPLLGDVPVIGALFSSYNKTQHDDKLYIFVKANIIRPEAAEGLSQIKHISHKNRDEFEKDESIFQNYQEIPGIKPPPIDPQKVLERDVNEADVNSF